MMILYLIRNGVISVESVSKETKCGWRTAIGGFYNRNEMGNTARLGETYRTTNYEDAILWQRRLLILLNDIIQVAKASKSDLDFWVEQCGKDEDSIPKSRYVY